MQIIGNPHRGVGLGERLGISGDPVSTDAAAVAALLARCPAHRETPLVACDPLARAAGVAALHLKDERGRMGLGSFKALGAACAIAQAACRKAADPDGAALRGETYVCASAGNHGLSVAAGARVFGAEAVIFLAESVPEAFADRLRARDARVERAGATYEESMAAAAEAAAARGWTLLSDSSWPGYLDLPRRVMQGYLQLAAETAARIPAPPTHILLQAGVGGLAAAVAAHARRVWGDAPIIVVAEPDAAPALMESVRAGRVVRTEGPVSAMGRLDCKEPSLLALAALSRDADLFATISESEAAEACAALADAGLDTTPSGAAGVAALLAARGRPDALRLHADSRVLAILTEGREAP